MLRTNAFMCVHIFLKSHAPTCTCTFLLMISRYSTNLQMALCTSREVCQHVNSDVNKLGLKVFKKSSSEMFVEEENCFITFVRPQGGVQLF